MSVILVRVRPRDAPRRRLETLIGEPGPGPRVAGSHRAESALAAAIGLRSSGRPAPPLGEASLPHPPVGFESPALSSVTTAVPCRGAVCCESRTAHEVRTSNTISPTRSFREQRLRFPRRLACGPHAGEVAWGPLLHHRALRILKNPRYAGAFAYGRSRARRTAAGGATRTP
jgi:hypothetical protein